MTTPTAAGTEEVPAPMRTINADLTRFTTAGRGTVHGAAADGLEVGTTVGVTDDDADTYEAEVLATDGGTAEIRVFWDRVLYRS
jgi:hypothetical protein